MRWIFLCLITSVLTMLGCDRSGDELDLNQAQTVIWRFGDSSVPPQYHRSYEIRVTATEAGAEVRCTVDSYGDLIAEKTYERSDNPLPDLLALWQQGNIHAGEKRENDGCTGGTSRSVALLDKQGEPLMKAWGYSCGGTWSGTIRGEFLPFGAAMEALVPDLRTLTATE